MGRKGGGSRYASGYAPGIQDIIESLTNGKFAQAVDQTTKNFRGLNEAMGGFSSPGAALVSPLTNNLGEFLGKMSGQATSWFPSEMRDMGVPGSKLLSDASAGMDATASLETQLAAMARRGTELGFSAERSVSYVEAIAPALADRLSEGARASQMGTDLAHRIMKDKMRSGQTEGLRSMGWFSNDNPALPVNPAFNPDTLGGFAPRSNEHDSDPWWYGMARNIHAINADAWAAMRPMFESGAMRSGIR